MSGRDANLTEQELADLQSIELDLGPGPAAPAPPGSAFGAHDTALTADLQGGSMLETAALAPPPPPPSAPLPAPGLGPDPFALGEPYAPAVPPPKPSVRDLAHRVAEGGARAAAQLSPMLEDARAKTSETTARAVDAAKSRGLVPLGAILVAVGVLAVIVFVVARFVLPESSSAPAGDGERRTKHVAESAGATHE